MAVKSSEIIMSATSPYQIFSMKPDKLDDEFEEYREAYKPKAYSSIQNFMIMQKVTMIYRQARELLDNNEESSYLANSGELIVRKKNGNSYTWHYSYMCDTKVSKMYVTDRNIIFVTPNKYRKYHENYIEKTKSFMRINDDAWKTTEMMLPKIVYHFETKDNLWVIVLKKPCERIYSLREILQYFGGKIRPEFVASIINRLYHFVCYLEISGINHNAITVDNLFFAPGRKTKEGEEYTVEDMRIVGVYGGWFFSTWCDEKISGLPREVNEIIPKRERENRYSSFRVDELSIKRLAKELLGAVDDRDFSDVPLAMSEWLNRTSCEGNAYKEFTAWESVNIESFGKRRFIEMDVSI